MALYSGVPSIRLEGDVTKALAAIPAAKTLLQTVQRFVDRSGANTFSASQSYGPDVSIYVLCANGQNIISIVAGEPEIPFEFAVETPIVDPWPDILSGLVHEGAIRQFPNTTPGGPPLDKIIKWIPTPACARTHHLSEGFQSNHRLTVRPWSAFTEWRARPPDTSDYSQYKVPRPSWWSGKMKKVVQVLMGFGRANSRFLKPGPYASKIKRDGVQIRYDYRFNRTHGIVTASDGRLWLVEVGVSRGVIAMPLPIYEHSTSEMFINHYRGIDDTPMVTVLEDLGCLPTGEGFPTTPDELALEIQRGNVIELASAQYMRTFYDKSGYSSACGWAFSESGNEAHNVAYYYRDDDPIQRSAWYQLSISIGETIHNRQPNQPIAGGSAQLHMQKEGHVFAPSRYDGATPIYYYEPILNPPQLLRHDAAPSDGDRTHKPECDAPVFVAIMDGQLKVASFYYTPSLRPGEHRSELGEGECPYNGSWATITSAGSYIPMMCYSNDVDTRRPCELETTIEVLTSSGAGRGGIKVTELVDAPGWALLTRAAYFRQSRSVEAKIGEEIAGVLVAPYGSREAYFMLEGSWYGGHTTSLSVSYDSLRDPNIGYGWASGLGPRYLNTPIGQLDAYTCGEHHVDRRVIATGTVYDGPCSEYADGGGWMNQCDNVISYVAPEPHLVGYETGHDYGRDFSGSATLISAGGLGGPLRMPIGDVFLSLYNDPPGTHGGATPLVLAAVHSSVGDNAIIYTKLNINPQGQGVIGYVPGGAASIESYPCFIGANHP